VEYKLKQLTSLFKALSDPTRLRIVHLLDRRSLCVCDLQQALGCSQPFISRHLSILRATKLVRTERRDGRVRYSLSRAPLLNYPIGKFLSEVVPFLPGLQADVQRLGDLDGLDTLNAEGLTMSSDSERPAASLGNDAGEGEGPASFQDETRPAK